MSGPTTEAGRDMVRTEGDVWGFEHGIESGETMRADLAVQVCRIEVEAARLWMRGLQEEWERRKRTRRSSMHDVGGVIREVDDLLTTETKGDGAPPRAMSYGSADERTDGS